ncbi:hypothetical protein HDA40_007000 [Hamadaea flava]|uniref:Uncharacterized protein n=1 Tax=Hamadaea flava TaxID=1742688 RepID=A0ABV8M2W4_9ACTN|nr:hypothetical protein [Hamadaea flava]MCP2328493.1 hypothetical protein [Hamadaea flava]
MSENDTPPTESQRRIQRDIFGRRMDEVQPRWERRKAKIRAEIERNRRGEYKVPTWVLLAVLIAIVVGFTLFVALA